MYFSLIGPVASLTFSDPIWSPSLHRSHATSQCRRSIRTPPPGRHPRRVAGGDLDLKSNLVKPYRLLFSPGFFFFSLPCHQLWISGCDVPPPPLAPLTRHFKVARSLPKEHLHVDPRQGPPLFFACGNFTRYICNHDLRNGMRDLNLGRSVLIGFRFDETFLFPSPTPTLHPSPSPVSFSLLFLFHWLFCSKSCQRFSSF